MVGEERERERERERESENSVLIAHFNDDSEDIYTLGYKSIF